MKVKIEKAGKNSEGNATVEISYPGALNTATLSFKGTLPPEVAEEFFKEAPKAKMENMRGGSW